MSALIEARNLVVDYDGVVAVNGVDLTIREGETVALVGESGCGKSTLGRALLGLTGKEARIGGEVLYGGRSLYGIPPRERRLLHGRELALVFQDPMTRLDPLQTVEQHFAELLRTHKEDPSRERMRDALAEVGVPPDRLELYPHEFSGGMRQRIMIALGLMLRPKFLVADEPTTSLDVIVEAQIIDLLRRLATERRLTTLLITHNLGLVAQIADRVVVMYAGDIVEDAPLRQLFEAPAHPYTQGLLASTIHMGTTALHSIPGAPPDLAHPPPACRFHPRCPRAHEICASKRPPRALGALCWFPGVEPVPQAAREEWGAKL
ncbi:MAG TPA: ABC transporter ATP-binding protein [Candidatus Thermoplasmatota archaeon]|nr:ABC transporter ATP-binding protein [Candidatus Thermoplasmatota archaeon]